MPPSRVRPSFRQTDSSVSDRTLFAIVGERETRPDPNSRLIEIGRIRPDPDQPRKSFPAETLDELAASIASLGFLQPLVVRREGADFMLISGERRYRAALMLGLTEVPAVVKDLAPDDVKIASLVENLQRENIPPDEEAAAFDELLRGRHLGVRELSRMIHKDPSYVSRRVRVYEDAELGPAVRAGKVAVSTAERILGVREPTVRGLLVERALAGALDQKTARAIVRANRPAKPGDPTAALDATVITAAPSDEPVERDAISQVLAAVDRLISSGAQPAVNDRRRLRAAQERLFAWLVRQNAVGW